MTLIRFPSAKAVPIALVTATVLAASLGTRAISRAADPSPSPKFHESPASDSLSGLRYLGYFAVPTPEVVSHHGNVIFTVAPAEIEKAGRFGLKAIEHVGGALTGADDQQFPNALSTWRRRADSIRPYINNVAAFYLYDEPYGQLGHLGRPEVFRRLQRAARAVKQSFPNVPIAFAEAADNLTSYYSSQPFRVPPEVDWIGFDCYDGTFSRCGSSRKSIPEYLALAKRAIDPSKQRLFLVPPSYFLLPSTGSESTILSAIRQGGPCTAAPTCAAQDSLAAIARQYLALAKSDPTIVAILAFPGGLYEESHNLFIGALDMPRVRAAYDDIYRQISGSTPISAQLYPAGARLIPADGASASLGMHSPGDTVWPAIEVLDAGSKHQLGVNVACTPSGDSKVLWRARATGTNHPINAFFGWILGRTPRRTYELRCQSPSVANSSVTFSATTR